MAEKLPEDILSTLFNNMEGDIWSIVNVEVRQVMLNLLRKYEIGETVEAHPAQVFDGDGSTKRLPRGFNLPLVPEPCCHFC